MEPLNDEELQKLDKDIILDNNYMNVSGQSIDVKLNIIPGPIPVVGDMPCVIIDEAVHNLEKIKNDIADAQALVTRNHMRFLETNKIHGTGFDFCLPCVLPDGSLNEAALNDALAIQNYYENYIKIEGLEGAQKIVGGLGNAERKRVEEIIKQYNDYIDEEDQDALKEDSILLKGGDHVCVNCGRSQGGRGSAKSIAKLKAIERAKEKDALRNNFVDVGGKIINPLYENITGWPILSEDREEIICESGNSEEKGVLLSSKADIELKDKDCYSGHCCHFCMFDLSSLIKEWLSKQEEVMTNQKYCYEIDDEIVCPSCSEKYYPVTGNMEIEVNLKKVEDNEFE